MKFKSLAETVEGQWRVSGGSAGSGGHQSVQVLDQVTGQQCLSAPSGAAGL